MDKINYKVYSYTETSRKNSEENEDSHYSYYDSEKDFCLLLVCDGLGGAPGGQIASQIIRDTFVEYFNQDFISKVCQINEKNEITNTLKMRLSSILSSSRHLLKQEFDKENKLRLENNKPLLPEKHKRGGFASTFSCVVIIGSIAFYTWVGDSRVYLLKNGRLNPLSYDHSDGISEKDFNELESVLSGKVMTKCISPFAEDEYVDIDSAEIFSIALSENDIIFCASDGIFDFLLPWTLEMVFVKNLSFGYSPEEYVKKIYYQIRGVFQDDTTVSIVFCGNPKPFGKKYPFLDDSFFYLNSVSFNEEIEKEFNIYPTNWDLVVPDKNYKEYKKRKEWNEILKGVAKLTSEQQILEKAYCLDCKSTFFISNENEIKCLNNGCKSNIYKKQFLEIYLSPNLDYDNPYQISICKLILDEKNNLSFNFETLSPLVSQKINKLFKDYIEIKYLNNKWEVIGLTENPLFVFYPQFFDTKGYPEKHLENIMIGKSVFPFIYPYQNNFKEALINNNVYQIKENIVYIFGLSKKDSKMKPIKDMDCEYIELNADFVDINSGFFIKKNDMLFFQDLKYNNSLFINNGKRALVYDTFPSNIIVKINDLVIAFRGK